MTKILAIHNFGKYLGKLLDACLQLDFLDEWRKGLLPTLVYIYKTHSTQDFRQPTYGKQRLKKLHEWKKSKFKSSENVPS